MQQYPEPRKRFKGRNKKFLWVFKITSDFKFQSLHLDKTFDSHWLKLEPNGMVTIKANENGYAWDGCSPKKSLLGLVIVGTPDGHIDITNEKPLTHDASLIHDAFYQYLEHVPVTKKEIDRQFYEVLRKKNFPLARLYYVAVRIFGGRGVVQKNIPQPN
jgi:hypothetical protein